MDPLTTNATFAPRWDARNVEGYIETVEGPPPDVVYGWDVVVEGDTLRWRECSAGGACGFTERSRPKHDLLALERLGGAGTGGAGPVDVVKLVLAPGPHFIVPYVRPVPSRLR